MTCDAVGTDHDRAVFAADRLGADVARAEAEAINFVVAHELLAARIADDDPARLRDDRAAALLNFLPLAAEILEPAWTGSCGAGCDRRQSLLRRRRRGRQWRGDLRRPAQRRSGRRRRGGLIAWSRAGCCGSCAGARRRARLRQAGSGLRRRSPCWRSGRWRGRNCAGRRRRAARRRRGRPIRRRRSCVRRSLRRQARSGFRSRLRRGSRWRSGEVSAASSVPDASRDEFPDASLGESEAHPLPVELRKAAAFAWDVPGARPQVAAVARRRSGTSRRSRRRLVLRRCSSRRRRRRGTRGRCRRGWRWRRGVRRWRRRRWRGRTLWCRGWRWWSGRRLVLRWWRSGWRRGMRRRRCARRRSARPSRRLSRRRTLRWLLRLAVGADLALRLRDDQRRGLCMRCGTCKLHRGESSRRKQHKTKFGHGISFPGITFVASVIRRADQQISVRP